MMMKLLLIGVIGWMGQVCVDLLFKQLEFEVMVFVCWYGYVLVGVWVVEVDLMNDFLYVFQGIMYVIYVVGLVELDGVIEEEQVDCDVVVCVVDYVFVYNVQKFVVVSLLFVYWFEQGLDVLYYYLQMKCEGDDCVIVLGVDYVILCLGLFIDDLGVGKIVLIDMWFDFVLFVLCQDVVWVVIEVIKFGILCKIVGFVGGSVLIEQVLCV